MNDRWESDGRIRPTRPPNNPARAEAEAAEERRPAKGNTASKTRPGPRAELSAPSALDRVRRIAIRDKDARFTALLHHVTVERLRVAYLACRPQAAAGVDGVTWHAYGQDLETKLRDLHGRVQRGAYRAKPSRRVYMPKADGRQRPLGIAALEDKIVQRAVVEVLNAVYEADFLGFSYGFRPGRSPHDALDALAVGILGKKVNWILDADIRDFFSRLDHAWIEKFLKHRIADQRILRLIRKWLNAGVIENGTWTACDEGTPQGATVSPLLANVYLHYVLDLWVHHWRKRYARGDVVAVRFADDFIVGFEHRNDAERFRRDLDERLAKFSLELQADKTRLIEFGRYAAERRAKSGLSRPRTFNFLGFTHICGRDRSGRFSLKRVTISKRMQAKLRTVNEELMRRRHLPIPEQGRWLGSVVRGHLAYFAVPGNIHAVGTFREQSKWYWMKALSRRSQRTHVTWERMARLSQKWLPAACVMHPYPDARFDARTRGRSPVR